MNKRRMAYRSLRFFALSCIALLICSAASADDRVQDRPKVRAITAFVRLTLSDYKRELAETVDALNLARKKFQQAGWEVQTIRITTQPFPEFVRGLPKAKALDFLLELDNLAAGS